MKMVLSAAFLAIVPGVFGGMTALELTGIGMCTFIPLTARVALQPVVVAILTAVLALFLPVSWKTPAVIFSLPMLLPAGISFLSLFDRDPELPRFLVAVASILVCWFGCFLFGGHRSNPQETIGP